MTDTLGVLVVRDGNTPSLSRNLGGRVDGAGTFYPDHGLRADGQPIGAGYPMPVQVSVTALASVTSSVLERARVLKASPGNLYGFQANASQSGWVMLFDLTSEPADGAVAPRKVWQINTSQTATLEVRFQPPLAMSAGATLVFSTTGPVTKTAAASAYFSGETV
jgi:hypothetical protein